MESSSYKVYKKATILFIGELFDEMLDDNVLTHLRCKAVSDSASLTKSLFSNPKVVVLRCLPEISNNNFILQTVINSCPNARIIIIGGEKNDFKKRIAGYIDTFMDESTSFDAFKTSLEEVLFNFNYGEDFIESELQFNQENKSLSHVFALVMCIVFASIIFVLFHFINTL